MIGCEHAQHLFEPYLNDELSASMTAELDAHRLECPGCQHQLTLLEACGNVVRLDTREPGLSEDFGERLMAILDQGPGARGSLQLNRALKWAGGLLGIAAAAATVVVLLPSRESATGPRVMGVAKHPPKAVSAAEWITDVPFDSIFGAGDLISSTLELGQYGFSHLHDRLGVPPTAVPLPALDLGVLPTRPELDSDVFDTLPDLDDGGELM